MAPWVFLCVVVGCTSCLGGIAYTADRCCYAGANLSACQSIKVASDHVACSADALVSLGIVELYNDKGC